MASWLVRSSMDRTVRVRALAGDTVLCSWASHFTLTVPLSTQEYKWVPAICWGNLTNCWGVTCDGLASRPGGVEILLAASCYGNRDKLRPDEPVGSIRLHFFFFFYENKDPPKTKTKDLRHKKEDRKTKTSYEETEVLHHKHSWLKANSLTFNNIGKFKFVYN